MSEIKVGEYVRYDDGRIFKVIEEEVDYYNYLLKTSINECGITKHSKNIIDLIEIGDYVNGKLIHYILGKTKNGETIICYGNGKHIDNNHIKSIVTHEKFKRMEFRV